MTSAEGIARNRGRGAPAALHFCILHSALLILISGCKPAPPPAPPTVSDSTERGPIKFAAQVSPKVAWIGDPITISLSAATPEDLVVQFPTKEELGEVNVRSVGEPEARPAQTGTTWARTYVIDTLTAGTLEIPPLVMKYGKKPPDGGEPTLDNELALGTMKVEIRSALTSQDSMVAPRDITGARGPTPAPWKWWQIALLAAWAVVTTVTVFALYDAWRRRGGRRARIAKPEEWALAALDDLAKFDWIAAGAARDLYYRLTEIVRGYIESKFGLRAPEMTTTEFLNALARNSAALPYDNEKLGRFLEACDLVKYAAMTPRREDAGEALATAGAFVHSTAAAVVHAEAQSQAQAGQYAAPPPAGPVSDDGLMVFEADDEKRWMGSGGESGGRAA